MKHSPKTPVFQISVNMLKLLPIKKKPRWEPYLSLCLHRQKKTQRWCNKNIYIYTQTVETWCSSVLRCSVMSNPCDPMDHSPPSSSVHGNSPGKNIGVGCPFPPPGDLSDSGIQPTSPVSPALAGEFFTTNATWEAHGWIITSIFKRLKTMIK